MTSIHRTIIRTITRQRWIRFGLRDRLARACIDPDKTEPEAFEVDFFGASYIGDISNFIDWNVYFYGAFERGYLELLSTLALERKEAVFIDIGANIGHHSLYMARRCKAVHSVEPNPAVRHKLAQKIKSNDIRNIAIHPIGLGATDERLQFFLPKSANSGTGSFIRGYSDNNEDSTILEVRNGDSWVLELNAASVDIIKIDVEGFEKNVLVGLRETISRFRPVITMEWSSSTKASFSDLSELASLLPKDYSVYAIKYDRPNFVIFNKSAPFLDVFDFGKEAHDLLLVPNERSPK